jgi:hypothetical protein
MTPRRSTARARKMAWKREMLREIARLQALAEQSLAEFDQLLQLRDAKATDGQIIEGRIIGDTIITEAETD